MNKFRKFLIGMIVAAGTACLGGAVACADTGAPGQGGAEPVYYQLDLNGRGFDIVFEGDLAELNEKGENFQFSGKVKEGVDVRFKVQLGADTVGTPSVKVNGEELTPNSSGVYSFTMREDSQISVFGLNTMYTMKLIKVKETENEDGGTTREERRIKFYDATGKNELGDEVKIEGGEDFTFALWTSPYYEDTFTVKCGYEELERDGLVQGTNLKLYTVHGVSSDGEIDVIELEQKLSFANHNDPATYGNGTEANPYKISEPIDLYYLAAIINDDFNGSFFSSLYYELTADIDMDGEQLYVIGDGSNDTALFNGHFNGNGHTISNFYITDEVYDQESFSQEYLPYVGLFGYASAYIDNDLVIHPATIENVTLKDFSVSAHPATANYSATVGSLVGFGVGVEITGCRAEGGDLFVENDDNQIVVMGGLVGRLQGAYGATSAGIVTANAFVRSSSANMSVEGSGSPRSAGGIVGYLVSADETAIAYVVSSYSEGSVNGAMHSGGIVGTLGRFSSVGGSYSAAQVSASNYFDGLNVSPDFLGAYAGGIAGYAEESTVISGCYAANYTSASVNIITAEGANQTSTGAFAGGYAVANSKSADLANLIEHNNSRAVVNHPKSVFTGLGWSDDEWDYTADLPRAKISATARKIKINAQQKDNPLSVKRTELTGINPMSYWYNNGLAEYVKGTTALGISWGYYFDEAMTKRVPYGYVPFSAETTLYIDYAKYEDVAGTYYFEDTQYSNGAYITLTSDGKAEFRNGGLYHVCKYTYDDINNRVVIYRSALAALSFTEIQIDGGYFAYGGTVGANGVLSLEAYVTVLNPSGSAEAGTQYVSEEAALRAVKAANFAYGEYQDENGVTYLFRKNGTGIMTDTGTAKAFTFTPAGETFNITLERTGAEITGRQISVTVSNGKAGAINNVTVQLKDNFKGSWQVNANAFTVFTFDGIDTVTMSVIGQSAKQAGYTRVKDNEISFTIDEKVYKATFTDGNVVIEGETYYVSDGLTGKWFMVSDDEWIEISLDGTGEEGYGNAVITYTVGASQSFDAQYDVINAADGTYLRVYIGDKQYGELNYNAAERSASGSFYSLTRSRYESFTFYLYDAIRGVWTGISDEFDSVTFNGRSASEEDSKVDVTTVGNSVKRGTYTLNGATGTMTVNGVSYTISYSEKDNKVTVTTVGETSESQQLAPRDEWYQVKLYGGEAIYEFDGKSNVNGTGSVKVKEGELTNTLPYTVEGGTVKIEGSALVPNNNGFQWNSETLKFKTGFVGEWIVSGTDKLLTIEEVSGYLTAKVTCTGVSGTYNFVYSPTANTLTLTEGDTVTVIKLMGRDEMSISRTTAEGSVSYNCAKTADEYKGVYTGEDGTWLLDGLGNCLYGGGTAVFTPASGESVKYKYKINQLGLPYIKATENVLFVEAETGGSGYTKDGVTYKTVVVNAYYDRTVYDFDTRTAYYFDGISTLWVRENGEYTAVYTYEIINGVYCELIDANGVRWNGKMEQPASTIWLTVSEQTKAVAGEGENAVTYSFGVTTLWQVNSDGSYTKAYSFVSTDEDGVYELTDSEGNKYTATLTEGENGNTLEITPVEGTTEQA